MLSEKDKYRFWNDIVNIEMICHYNKIFGDEFIIEDGKIKDVLHRDDRKGVKA